MKIEHLVGKLEDGARVKVIRTQAEISGHPDILQIPSFKLENGERLSPIDDSLRLFKTVQTNKLVRILS